MVGDVGFGLCERYVRWIDAGCRMHRFFSARVYWFCSVVCECQGKGVILIIFCSFCSVLV